MQSAARIVKGFLSIPKNPRSFPAFHCQSEFPIVSQKKKVFNYFCPADCVSYLGLAARNGQTAMLPPKKYRSLHLSAWFFFLLLIPNSNNDFSVAFNCIYSCFMKGNHLLFIARSRKLREEKENLVAW